MKRASWLSATAAGLIFSTGAYAQTDITGIEDLEDRQEDIQRDVTEEIEEGQDTERFGFGRTQEGFSGSLSITGSTTDGNAQSTDVSGAGRLTYGSDPWVNTLGFGIEYAEDDEEKNEHEVFLTYGARRDVTDRFYLFGLGRYEYDGFGPYKEDAFLGVGPGYRVINQPDVAWRLQGGPGARYVNPQSGGDSDTEAAIIAASRLYYEINDDVFLNNDTDILNSDTGTLVTNDLGVNFRVNEQLLTRVSLRSEYNSDPAPRFDETDNTLGFAVVYGF